MNGIELKVPIRLYWDVSPVPAVPLDYESICRDILGLRILSINLTDLTPGVSEAALSILGRFKGQGPAVALTVAPETITGEVLDRLAQLGVRTVLVRVEDIGELPEIPEKRPGTPALGISFEVTARNWRQLPPLVRYCSDNGIDLLAFPMQRLHEKGQSFYLSPLEKSELAALLKREPVPASLRLTIHDPFLWKIFFPQVSFPDGGCQAANTMVYISADGAVTPCPSLPVTIGRLDTASLREIVRSEEKKRIRNKILTLPTPCFGCAEASSCKGGCRGRAYVEQGSLDAADPGCLS